MTAALNMRGLLLVVSAAICSAFGIVGMKSGLAGGGFHFIPFIPGLAIYGLGVALGIVAIGRYQLSVAYPVIVGLTLAALAGISVLVLGEAVTALKLGGTVSIVLGVALLVGPSNPQRAVK